MNDGYESAERVQDREGRQYHLGVAPGEVAPFVMLVGDPARAELVAGMFDEIELERRNRGFVTFTGRHEGLRLTVTAIGIGPANMEIAVIELCRCVDRPTFIRCGTCGALQPEIELGDLIVTQGAYRMEDTSLHFVGEGYPAVSDAEVQLALVRAAAAGERPVHVGITATAPGFYGAQGRSIPGFPPRRPELLADLERQGVKSVEMEISTLLTLATLHGCRAGAVCVAFGTRKRDKFIHPSDKQAAELRCVEVGLRAFHGVASCHDV